MVVKNHFPAAFQSTTVSNLILITVWYLNLTQLLNLFSVNLLKEILNSLFNWPQYLCLKNVQKLSLYVK